MNLGEVGQWDSLGVSVSFWCWLRLALTGVAEDVLGLFR
jgi:hypothetical protein